MKAKAEVYHGNETCTEKFTSLLEEKGLPKGLLLTLKDIHEYGYVKDTGFVWLRRRSRHETISKRDGLHMFDNINIRYDEEIKAYIETNKIRNLTGVKVKEFMIWLDLTEIYVQQRSCSAKSMITFKTPMGLTTSFPVSVFKPQLAMFGDDAVNELAGEANEGK
ncbi:Detected protein of confused Function [Hibiscus syriacus]|uniref:Detected protein of confused Function n=1 Tax=Hibiscus syriacus TaxID=106335 RepID=A0A6A3BCG1_HIBSY|nr:uncharacterized protein LOC120218390 [Hibiscus syriacus]KAE8714243.1 Detected protein of confused Function [Hibiscus syriacus]